MQEIGVLPKLLESDIWVQKFGGIFKWDDGRPNVGFFDHSAYEEDGVHRWTAHVNRSEFDHILLNHAIECGAAVFQGVSVTAFEAQADGCTVTLKDGTVVRGQFFVDASGRRNSIAAKVKRGWLSTYKNIAIWQHYTDCKHSYEIEGDWNIFAAKQASAIACAAFKDGWCWYIPVKKIVDGKRVVTHSVGIVTIPALLKEEGKDFTDPDIFLSTIKTIPMIKDLVQEAKPISDKMSTATNYSMINDQFSNYDERWVLIGDAAYFVDPLFSSGVAFAMGHAISTALLLKTSADPSVAADLKKDLWRDYDREWHAIAQSFSLAIDQWYHAIGNSNPDSVYWHSRGTNVEYGLRESTFELLLSTTLEPDILRILTNESSAMEDLEQEGPYMRALAMAQLGSPQPQDQIELLPGVELRESIGLDIPGFKGYVPPPLVPVTEGERAAIADFWRDPVANGDLLESPLAQTIPCHRFVRFDGGEEFHVRSLWGPEVTVGLWEVLQEGPLTFAAACERLTPAQLALLSSLVRSGIAELETPASAQANVA